MPQVGANIEEANAGYTKKDFSAKMSIASKEARETLYWLKLLDAGNFIEFDFKEIKDDCEEIIKLLAAIVKSTQESL